MPRCTYRGLRVILLFTAIAWRADAADMLAVHRNLLMYNEPRQLSYLVMREGQTIGRYSTQFAHSNTTLTVTNRLFVEIKLAFTTIYSFRHGSTEIWRDGRLESLVARTTDDGSSKRVSYRGSNTADKGHRGTSECTNEDSSNLAPGTFWSEALLFHDCMIDPVDGRQRPLKVSFRGSEILRTPFGALKTRRYRVERQEGQELWFGPKGFLVRMHLRAKDDSIVVLKRVPMLAGEIIR